MKNIVILIVLILSFSTSSSAGTVSFTLDGGPYNSSPAKSACSYGKNTYIFTGQAEEVCYTLYRSE